MRGGQHAPVDTVVFDLDGTLVDSVYQHVLAWQAAFRDVGLRVSGAAVHHSIGMGGDRLVSQVAGTAVERAVGDEVRRAHDHHFRDLLSQVHETKAHQTSWNVWDRHTSSCWPVRGVRRRRRRCCPSSTQRALSTSWSAAPRSNTASPLPT